MRRTLAVCICAALASACTPYRTALLNDTDGPVGLTVRRVDGSELRGDIPGGEKLMMFDRTAELESVDYSVGSQACRLTREEMAIRATRSGDIDVVPLSPCRLEP